MKRCFFLLFAFILWAHVLAEDYSFEIVASNSIPNQSAANYGKYLFVVSNKMEYIMLYDLDKMKRVCILKQGPRDEINRSNGNVIYHSNQSCFGKQKFKEGDLFPLLYVSQRNETDSTGAFLSVLRIIPFKKGERIDSFKVHEIQKIYFPPMNDDNCMGLPSAVIDTDSDFMYTYSRNLNKISDNYTGAVITKFRVPQLKNNGVICPVVYLKDSDRLDSFSCGFNLTGAQGGCYKKGKIYLTQGCPRRRPLNNYVYFRVIDIAKRRCIRMIDMLTNDFTSEPEGCWCYRGNIMLTNNGRNIYVLTGVKY